MPELKFKPSLWISLYLTAIQYFVISLIVIATFAFIDINNERSYSIAFAIFIPVATVLAVTYTYRLDRKNRLCSGPLA